ncbi:hypothetical protein [Psychrobacillus sp. NPDC093180]|uniref:hypothetical protein n=1 Tax=Psychrobacillus sp. NPDC093180 TaxID=3364489 RepID=UPI00380D1045
MHKVSGDLLAEMMSEQSCIEDCLEQMKIHMRKGNYDLADDRCRDVQRSFRRLENIKRKMERRNKVIEFNQRGVSVEVVKRRVQ